MSEDGFSPAWLALREPFDHAARSVALARRFAAMLPAQPHLVDLGCGLGSDLRFLAPQLSGPAHWCLVDHSAVLLGHAAAAVDAWQARQATSPLLSMTQQTVDLRQALPSGPWHGVVTQALLDLVSAEWLTQLADWLAQHTLPLLAGLTVDGRVTWTPAHALDGEVQAAFRAHQHLDRGFGPSPGTDACKVLRSLLEARGYTVSTETADWQVPASATAMLRFMVNGTADAARVTHADPARVDAWQTDRLADVAAGQVSLMVGHLDLLALPPDRSPATR